MWVPGATHSPSKIGATAPVTVQIMSACPAAESGLLVASTRKPVSAAVFSAKAMARSNDRPQTTTALKDRTLLNARM